MFTVGIIEFVLIFIFLFGGIFFYDWMYFQYYHVNNDPEHSKISLFDISKRTLGLTIMLIVLIGSILAATHYLVHDKATDANASMTQE